MTSNTSRTWCSPWATLLAANTSCPWSSPSSLSSLLTTPRCSLLATYSSCSRYSSSPRTLSTLLACCPPWSSLSLAIYISSSTSPPTLLTSNSSSPWGAPRCSLLPTNSSISWSSPRTLSTLLPSNTDCSLLTSNTSSSRSSPRSLGTLLTSNADCSLLTSNTSCAWPRSSLLTTYSCSSRSTPTSLSTLLTCCSSGPPWTSLLPTRSRSSPATLGSLTSNWNFNPYSLLTRCSPRSCLLSTNTLSSTYSITLSSNSSLLTTCSPTLLSRWAPWTLSSLLSWSSPCTLCSSSTRYSNISL